MTEDICTNNESLCTTAKENFNTMKNSFAITYDYIKEKAKSGSEKLKEWLKIGRKYVLNIFFFIP